MLVLFAHLSSIQANTKGKVTTARPALFMGTVRVSVYSLMDQTAFKKTVVFSRTSNAPLCLECKECGTILCRLRLTRDKTS